MDQVINFIINFGITYAMFKLAFSLYELRMEKKLREQEEVEKLLNNAVTIEKVHQSGKDFWLIYTYEQDPKFLAQGYTEKEAIDNLTKLHPNRSFYKFDRFEEHRI